MWNVGQKTISTWVKKTKTKRNNNNNNYYNYNNNNNIIKILHFQHYPHSTNWSSLTRSKFSQIKRRKKKKKCDKRREKWNNKVEPKCNKTLGGIIQNRGETGQESTQLFYQMCRISKICKCLSVQMIFGAIGTLAGLMDAPSPTGTHSEDVIHQEKKKHPFFSWYIRQQRKF